MIKTARHVVRNLKGGWSVRQSGSSRATKVFDKQADAVKFAREAAKREATELYVHRSDGTVQQKDNYGREPFPTRERQ